jgi:hypothetical protein
MNFSILKHYLQRASFRFFFSILLSQDKDKTLREKISTCIFHLLFLSLWYGWSVTAHGYINDIW